MNSFDNFLETQVRNRNIQKLAEYVVVNNINVEAFEDWIVYSNKQQIEEGIGQWVDPKKWANHRMDEGLGDMWDTAKRVAGGVGQMGADALGGIEKAGKWAHDKISGSYNTGAKGADAKSAAGYRAKADKLDGKWKKSDQADKIDTAGKAANKSAQYSTTPVQHPDTQVWYDPKTGQPLAQKPKIAPGTSRTAPGTSRTAPGTKAASTTGATAAPELAPALKWVTGYGTKSTNPNVQKAAQLLAQDLQSQIDGSSSTYGYAS